jgi:inhibitor of KinA
MKYQNPSINSFGEQAILISWEENIDKDLLYFILQLKEKLQNYYLEVNVEVINTYNSLLINYHLTINNLYGEFSTLKDLISESGDTSKRSFNQFSIPVCYDENFGIDLGLISNEKELKISELIKLHTQPIYTVFFIGFLPGFLYLGGLDKKLHISRKKTPRLKVQKGAVGIGGKQTGIYPQNSAGGWQLIGNCPVPLFNPKEKQPSPFKAGDQLKFEAVSLEEHQKIIEQVKAGKYQFKKSTYEH